VIEPTRYSRLIEGICEISKVPFDESMHTRFDVAVRGTSFSLTPTLDGNGDPDGLGYFADVGPLPAHRKGAVALELLETNLFMVGRDTPFFCVNPESGHILVAGVLPLDRLTPASTLEAMSVLAESISEWQASFLNRAGERPAGSAGRLASLASPARP